MSKGALPVLVGVGQAVSHWDGSQSPEDAPSPHSLNVEATEAALADAGVAASEIEIILLARTNDDCYPKPRRPHGANLNYPGTLADEIGAQPKELVYNISGGQSAQQSVNEAAARIHAGEADCILLAGSEATKASRAAERNGIEIDWSGASDQPVIDRGVGFDVINQTEIAHGLYRPPWLYALVENAMAAEAGQTRTQRRALMSKLWARFAAVARDNPYSQFQPDFDAEFLATPSKANYPFADPFLKWHMAQDSVNQGAALIIVSDAKADALGIAQDKRVYLHGAGEAAEPAFTERPGFTESWAMDVAINRALDQAGKRQEDMQVFDLYSCFPCAVYSSTAVLGIDPYAETRPLTVTGGLPFSGGPGNNYSMHAIAAMAERLRAQPGDFGLVLANGGWLSKEAVGIWSTEKPDAFTPVAPMAKRGDDILVAIEETPDTGVLESFTVSHGRDGPDLGIILARTEDGKRFIAHAKPDAMARLLEEESPVGMTVQAESSDGRNLFTWA
ncbi:MAG: acetyl-CoA acetyltransferase [Pseudomonadota bacterium]